MENQAPHIKSLTELRQFLDETVEKSRFKLEPIQLSSQNDWIIQDGVLSHRSGGFFHLCGLIHRETRNENLVLYQPQSALTGLALHRTQDSVDVLLQARAEPGNTGVAQYGPTIQSTLANYQRVHGGRPTGCLKVFNEYSPKANPISKSMQLDLGKRYFQKSKAHVYVETPLQMDCGPNMAWVPIELIIETLTEDHFLNTDLRSLLGIFDWELYLTGKSDPVSDNTSAPFFAALHAQTQSDTQPWELAPLTRLNRWTLTDHGVEDSARTGLSAPLYQTTCFGREVSTWTQPLIHASGIGHCILLMRQRNGECEYLVSLEQEFGISGQVVVMPSMTTYPGEPPKGIDQEPGGKIVAEFMQSDEGGRFHLHDNLYQLILINKPIRQKNNQHWISGRTLRQLLNTSNLAGIQLRGMSSLLIKTPHSALKVAT